MVATPTTKAALAAKARGVMLGGPELAKARELFVASIKPLSSLAACSVGVAGGQTRLQMNAFSNLFASTPPLGSCGATLHHRGPTSATEWAGQDLRALAPCGTLASRDA
jgi:hypothetical protein